MYILHLAYPIYFWNTHIIVLDTIYENCFYHRRNEKEIMTSGGSGRYKTK